jgi:hypothetical protein
MTNISWVDECCSEQSDWSTLQLQHCCSSHAGNWECTTFSLSITSTHRCWHETRLTSCSFVLTAVAAATAHLRVLCTMCVRNTAAMQAAQRCAAYAKPKLPARCRLSVPPHVSHHWHCPAVRWPQCWRHTGAQCPSIAQPCSPAVAKGCLGKIWQVFHGMQHLA